MSRLLAVLALATLPAVAHAQQPVVRRIDPARAAIAAVHMNWRMVTSNIATVAEELSEADYAYRPVGSVRTFGEQFAHVAGAQAVMCAAALGETGPAEDLYERTAKTKAALVEALKTTTAACERAYAQTDVEAAASTQLWGGTVPRMHALALNAVHNGEHYGNIITYMRIKGMVPPSSRR